MTVNELVCTFREGTDIFIHMRYADREKTERLWNESELRCLFRCL